MGTPPYTPVGSDTVRAAILTKINGNDADAYDKLDPANAIGVYADLPTRLTAIENALVDPSGSIKNGTAAERAAYTTVLEAMRWHETDTGQDFIYDNTNTTWYGIVDDEHDQTIAGAKTFSTINVNGPATFTSTLSSTQPITAGQGTLGTQLVTLDDILVLAQAF